MSEPPRPPGEGHSDLPSDPTAPPPAPPSDPSPGYAPPPPYGSPAPSSGAGAYPPPGSGAGGYPTGGTPPPPAYGQSPGYGSAPEYGAGAPAGYPTSDDKTWAMLAHFGGIVLGFIAPLIAMLAKGNESPTVRAHAVEALNFQLTWGVASIIAVTLVACSFGVLFFLPIITIGVTVVFSIIGGMKANEGQLYHYPVTVRLVK